MEERSEISCLKGRTVLLPGGHDKEGRPIFLVTIPPESPSLDIVPSLKFLQSIFSEGSRARGITTLIDARKGPWKVARSCIRQVSSAFAPEDLAQILVLRPDAFWDKQRVENCTQAEGQVIFIPRYRLNKFVDQSQLPLELGGNFIYNHDKWIENRQKVEEFYANARTTLKDLEELHGYLVNCKNLRTCDLGNALSTSSDMAEATRMLVYNAAETGRQLLQTIEYDNRTRKFASEFDSMSTPQETLDTIAEIDKVLNVIKTRQLEIEESWIKMQKALIDTKDLSLLEDGVVKVTNWILGPAEHLLNSRQKVGYDVASAEELRREHEALEFQCWDTYGAYAEIIHKINTFPKRDTSSVQYRDLLSQKDFMDFVCRSFALRLEKRRNILITSLRFFRLVSEYFDRTGEVFDSLVMGSKVIDFTTAGYKLKQLQESQANLDAVERELVKEGEKLSDMLSMPVKDALGREIYVDYAEDIINVRDILDATTARKNIFSDSVELQKLTLQQITHINTYEKDATQAVQWLDELFSVLLKDHGHVGCTVYEIQTQKDDHQNFQETAKDTFNYGCQLLHASSQLRQSCRLPLEDQENLSKRLKFSWQRLLNVSQEQMTRLRVSAVFHRSVEEQCNQLRDLREAVATIPLMDWNKKRARVKHYFGVREKLMVEVGRMVRLGRLLRSRLKEPLYYSDTMTEPSSSSVILPEAIEESSDYSAGDNEIAVEAISERLTEVTGLAEELDQALHSAQQDCSILTSSATSTSITSSEPETVVSVRRVMDPSNFEPKKPDDLRSDEEFVTASESTLQHSRSSSYNTAEECEQRYSPWWDYDKDNVSEDISKEKMVLAVGLPELPPARSVLKPSPEVPPGKIVHEVTETTHLKVQHSHTMGVSSFVLTSETVRDKKNEGACVREEIIKVTDEHGKEIIIPVQVEKGADGEEIITRMKEVGDFIRLKILEITPELTSLGNNLAEALELQRAHDEVLRQLQNKQSPVEELLRQADQLIATQRPRAEVYAAMAESLGLAWKDINTTLELRKQILDLNVQYHTKAQEFFDRMDELEASCTDTVVPIEIEAVKSFLNMIHELRRALLESLMGALQNGNSLIAKLKEIGAKDTLDSRPDRIRTSANRAISQVQGWMDQLHMKRQVLEATFIRRKTQLEQCLALAILASDLRELEDIIQERRELLASTDQLGDSTSSAELLLHEHKKLLPEAQQLQERALKITKATEQLVASGCFAGEEASEQSYKILSQTSDYHADLQNREALLERVIAFFRSAQAALNKLDQMDIQLTTSNTPSSSPQLIQLHAQCSQAIEDITRAPIGEGHAILNSADLGRTGTEGVRRMVEELENKKISLDRLCVAHREENIRINKALNNFLERQNDIYNWLVTIAEAFLQGHQDMGGDLIMSQDFLDLHNQLLKDLQTKGNEINELLPTLPPILEFLEDHQRKDVDSKVEELHQRWMKLKNILENRLDLARIYVKFHMEADIVNKEMDKLEQALQQNKDNISEDTMRQLEEKWESLVPLYQSAKNTGLTFIDQAKKVSEPYLDTKRACVCVESVLERLSGRQLVVTRNWQTFSTEVVEKRELLVRLEQTMAESTKTINWVSKLDEQLYPVITTSSTQPQEIASFLGNKLEKVLPDIKKAQNEVEQRIKAAEALISKAPVADEKTLIVRNKLSELNGKLNEISTDYRVLLELLIGYFNNLTELDRSVDNLNNKISGNLPDDVYAVENIIREHDASKNVVLELFRHSQNECEKIAQRISRQEPSQAAESDIKKLQHVLELQKDNWENQWREKSDALEAHRQLCQFDTDLNEINETLDDLGHQLDDVTGQYGESLSGAKATSQAFVYFEKTVELLEQRIQVFINTGEKLLAERHAHSPHIQRHIAELQERWNNFQKQVKDTRHLIDLSIPYFQLVEEANEWFQQGNSFLVSIARKSNFVKTPQEAQVLLNEIQEFLIPGELKQNERITKITELAAQIYGPQHLQEISNVLEENRGMLESFSSITSELNILSQNLKHAEEERERLQREEDARVKAEAEEAARRKAAEEEEARRRAAEEEARRIAAEEEARRKAAEEDARRKAAEEEARRKAAEEEARRKVAEEEARRKAAEEEARRKVAEEEARIKAAEEAQRKADEEEARRIAAEEAKRAAEEEVRKKAEEEARRKAEEEARKRAADEEARKRVEEEEEARRRASEIESQRVQVTEVTHIHKIHIEKEPDSITIEEIHELEAPVFTSPLSDAVIQEGSKFTFLCHVTGFPVPVVTWFKDGISIQNNPDYQTTFDEGLCTLTIEETFAEDSAKYTCKAINTAGAAETTATLAVKETEPEDQLSPPTFVKLLEPGQAKQGSGYQFHCRVEGNPLPTVQWFKNSECIDNSPDYVITYNNGDAILKFEKIFLEDKAEYTCKASNQLGMAQSTASLSVSPLEPTDAPKFILPLSNVMARAGQKIKLECEVSGLPPPILTWTHNSKAVKETRELKLQFEDNKAALLVFEAFPKDAGTYMVNAKNIAGEASSACSVSVKGRLPTETSDSELASDMEPVKPSIQLPLTNITIQEGNRVRLDCVIVGQPEPEVIWYHDDRPVKESPDFQLLFQGDRCSLVIQEAFAEDGGEYKVVALNSAGEASSKCILTVTPDSAKAPEEKPGPAGSSPKFIKLLSDVLVSEGDKVIFAGNVVGEPKPEIKWLLNNQPIDATDHVKLIHDEEGNIKLEIDNVHPDDKGVYTVKASNPSGDAKCFAQLIVKSSKPPETVKHEEVKSAPVFKEMFSDRAAFENTSTKFECIVVGKPTPKVKWLFNGEPISGKNFLISTSGDRQVLTIPELTKDLGGTITCVAENEAGKASCASNLSVQSVSAITLPDTSTEIQQHVESSYIINREVHTQSSTSMSSKMISSSSEAPEPQVQEIHSMSSQDQQTIRQVNQQPPQVSEAHKIQEYHQVGKQPTVIQEKSSATFSSGIDSQTKTIEHVIQKPVIRTRPPKFVTPVIGKIVDQETDVILEGILDGQPTPEVVWTKNNEVLKESDKIKIVFEHNRAAVTIKNANVEEAGRYTCTATNEAGKAISTADLVVRKTVFPPVFGRRLQAQVIKRGDRVIMEVEVTGTPEPTVTWFKDGVPIEEALRNNCRLKSVGITHSLIIEKAEMNLTGRYMVRAVNAGGEAQSIADIAVFEPTPDTMVEVVKTVVFEDVRKHETLTSAADKVISTVSSPAPPPIQHVPQPQPLPQLQPQLQSQSQTQSQVSSLKSEFGSFTEQKISKELKTIKLEHTVPEIPLPKPYEPTVFQKETEYEICNLPQTVEEKRLESEETGIETSSISKQSSLQYFVKKIKQSEEPIAPAIKEVSVPEPIKPELYKKFEDVSQKVETVQEKIEIPVRIEPRPVAPVPPPKPAPPLIRPEPIVQEYKSFTHEEFSLKPEPPAEICYTEAAPPTAFKTAESVSHKIKQIEEIPKLSTFEQKSESYSQKSESYQSSSFSRHVESGTKPVWAPPLQQQPAVERPASASIFQQERQFVPRPLSAQSGEIQPSQEGLAMEKSWAHKFSETQVEKSWPPLQEEVKTPPSWSVQSTLKKEWTPQTKTETIVKESTRIIESAPIQTYFKETRSVIETPLVPKHYIASVSHSSKVNEQEVSRSTITQSHYSSSYDQKQEHVLEERNIRPSEAVKAWPPTPVVQPVQPVQPVYQPYRPTPSIESLIPIRPVSVQDITDEVYLEPGPPPEIGFAQPPRERRQSYVEMVEHDLEKNLERMPVKVPPGGVRTIPPPPLPPKKEQPIAPPIPAKTVKIAAPPAKPMVEVPSVPFQRFPDLEPFPFRADPDRPRPQRVGPPPTPSKFIKGRFTDSDYESDFEAGRIPPKWKPSMSDTEEPSYRRVPPPRFQSTGRSRSVEPEPLPPSKFDHPPHFQGPPRPEVDLEAARRKKETLQQVKKQTKHFTKSHEVRREYQAPPPPVAIQPELKPGSPPIFVEPERKVKPESPKVIRHKLVADGYAADTDEPFIQQQKKFTKTEFRHEKSEYKQFSQQSSQKIVESTEKFVTPKPQAPHKFPQHKKHVSSSVSSSKKELVATPIITTSQHVYEQQEQHTNLEPFPFKPEPPRGKKARGPPPPSPSRFVKGEFRESDYESDYEGRISTVWRSEGEPSYKPVRPVLTPSGRHSQLSGRTPTPPTEFDNPPHIEGPPRPKFEPIEKFKPSIKLDEILKPAPKPVVFKPKPLPAVAPPTETIYATPAIQPGTPPEIAYAPGPKKTQYYRSTTSAPYHNAVQTETSNVMHFNESTENCHRTMSVQQTHKIIKFGDQTRRQEQKLESFPYRAEPERPRRSSLPPPPTPSKFIPGEFRESDYESEVEGSRIRPKWQPGGSDSESYHFRHVRAPAVGGAGIRSSSVPAPKERVLTPMEFDQAPLMPSPITITDITDGEHRTTSYQRFTESSNRTGKVVSRSRSYEPPQLRQEPALHPGTPPEYGYATDKKITKSSATKIASKHMDSMTQAFKTTTQKFARDIMNDVNKKTQQPPALKKDDGDAQVYREESRAAQYGTKHVDPDTGLIYFKYDFGYEFGIILPGEGKSGEIPVPKKTIIEPPKRTSDIEMPVYHETSSNNSAPQFRPKKFAPASKNVKWEPTSESEMSEYEGEHKKRNTLQGSRWEQSSCSPASLSPSLPSTSPAFNSTFAGSGRKGAETPPSCPSTPGSTHGRNSQNAGQARAPLFITPLRDIAVVSGQPAKFECIVQSEPPPNILWSKNGRIIENSRDYQLHYRNGVCRLTISQAYPEDAGTYTCTASNPVGPANTTATLQVPGERRSTYIK